MQRAGATRLSIIFFLDIWEIGESGWNSDLTAGEVPRRVWGRIMAARHSQRAQEWFGKVSERFGKVWERFLKDFSNIFCFSIIFKISTRPARIRVPL